MSFIGFENHPVFMIMVVTILVGSTITIIPKPEKDGMTTSQGAVSSDVRLCSEIGIQQLKNGGSAVDAIVATMFCRGVINGAHSGIGGGGFMLIYDPLTNLSSAIDFRESMPSRSKGLYLNPGLSIGVPGEVKGLYVAHQLYGKLPWNDLIKPSIYLAEHGYPMTEATIHSLKKTFAKPDELLKLYPRLGRIYLKESYLDARRGSAKFKDVRELATNKPLGEVLRKIASQGPAGFYTGPVARDIVDTVRQGGGHISLDDLKDYQPVFREAHTFTFWDGRFKFLSFPPPSSGLLLATIFKLLEELGLPDLIKRANPSNPYLTLNYSEGDFDYGKQQVSNNTGQASRTLSNNCSSDGCDHNHIKVITSTNTISKLKKRKNERRLAREIRESNNQNGYTQTFAQDTLKYGINKEGIRVEDGILASALRLFPVQIKKRKYLSVAAPYFKTAPNLNFVTISIYYHWLIEALKFSQSYAAFMGDPGIDYDDQHFAEQFGKLCHAQNLTDCHLGTKNISRHFTNSMAQEFLVESMFLSGNVDQMKSAISNTTTYARDSANYIPPNVQGTAHSSVIDKEGLIVSCTTSLNHLFGSKVMTQSGILLNDHMNDFTNQYHTYNRAEPYKRPHSSMVPTIVYDTLNSDGIQLAIGGSNGSRIISGVAQVILNLISFGDSLETAMARPRLYPNPNPDVLEVEENFPPQILENLALKKHRIVKVKGLNSVLPVMKFQNKLYATSDPRKSPIQSAAIY